VLAITIFDFLTTTKHTKTAIIIKNKLDNDDINIETECSDILLAALLGYSQCLSIWIRASTCKAAGCVLGQQSETEVQTHRQTKKAGIKRSARKEER
jgi:hypothetical protein